jgi:uncharacterized protein (TIGR00369 family)
VNDALRAQVAESLARQGLMQTLGVRLLEVAAGQVTLELPVSAAVTQQNGFVHAGAISSVLDSACGYAALTMMPDGSDVLAVEFKVNFVAPATGVSVHAVAEAVKSGRTVSVCRADAFAVAADGSRKLVALMQATMIRREA